MRREPALRASVSQVATLTDSRSVREPLRFVPPRPARRLVRQSRSMFRAVGTASFPEASCLCPLVNGPALADVTGGNMQGSCAPPGKGQVWSLYEPKSNLPQQVNNWSRKPAETAVSFQLCSAGLGVGNTFANCFSFACTINKDSKSTNGVKTATCFCPLGENPDGSAVPADTAVITPAGQCNSDVCAEDPVGAALVGAGSGRQ